MLLFSCRPQTCIDSLQDEGEEGGLSQGVLVAAVAAPLGLALLAVSVVLVAVLLYVCLARRKRAHGCMEKDGVVVTLNDGVMYEAQPYGESSFPIDHVVCICSTTDYIGHTRPWLYLMHIGFLHMNKNCLCFPSHQLSPS